MTPPETFRLQLKKKLGNNDTSTVISDLRKIIFPNSKRFTNLHLAAFQYNSIKKQAREGVIDDKSYNQELNKIRIALYELIDQLEEEEISLYQLELTDTTFDNRQKEEEFANDQQKKEKKARFSNTKKKARKFFKYVKSSVVALTMGFLFLVNGAEIIGSDPILSKCEPELTEIKNPARRYIFEAKSKSCFDFLQAKLQERNSPKFKEVVILSSRFKKNEDEYKLGKVESSFYLQEKSLIIDNLLEIVYELDCEDI